MKPNLDATCAFTLGAETPKRSTVRSDPGNYVGGQVGVGAFIGSKCGVSAPELKKLLGRTPTVADMEAVTPTTMRNGIFVPDYWLRSNGDNLPTGVDLMTVDHGYNRGAATSAMVTQRVVGITGDDVDGWLGDQTLAAIAAWTPNKLDLSLVDAKALQEALGVHQDGVVGPATRKALTALPVASALLVALYAAQIHDYRDLGAAAVARDPGWLVRAKNGLLAAQKLGA